MEGISRESAALIRACAAVYWARRWELHLRLTCLSTEGEMKGKVEREEELEQLSLVSDHGASEPHSPVQTQWQPGFLSQHPDDRREKIRPLVHFKLLHEHLLVHYHSKVWGQYFRYLVSCAHQDSIYQFAFILFLNEYFRITILF